jgi:hypothetical protein
MTNTFQNRIADQFFSHYVVSKFYHFQTQWYGAHKAVDAYLVKFLTNFDLFMEALQGTYGRLTTSSTNIHVVHLTDDDAIRYYISFAHWLKSLDLIIKHDQDLITVRDQMLADLHQLIYLLTFK